MQLLPLLCTTAPYFSSVSSVTSSHCLWRNWVNHWGSVLHPLHCASQHFWLATGRQELSSAPLLDTLERPLKRKAWIMRLKFVTKWVTPSMVKFKKITNIYKVLDTLNSDTENLHQSINSLCSSLPTAIKTPAITLNEPNNISNSSCSYYFEVSLVLSLVTSIAGSWTTSLANWRPSPAAKIDYFKSSM